MATKTRGLLQSVAWRRSVSAVRPWLEHFGVLSGLLFVLSAVVSALTMRFRFGLDYFSLATTSDVVLTGIKTIGIGVFTGFANFWGVVGIQWFQRRQRLRKIVQSRRFKASPARHYIQRLRDERDYVEKYQTIALLVLLIPASLGITFYYATIGPRIVYEGGANLPEECRYSEVEWIGSQSAIVRCGELRRIIRNSENVIFMRPRRQCDFWRLQCKYVGLEALRASAAKSASAAVAAKAAQPAPPPSASTPPARRATTAAPPAGPGSA